MGRQFSTLGHQSEVERSPVKKPATGSPDDGPSADVRRGGQGSYRSAALCRPKRSLQPLVPVAFGAAKNRNPKGLADLAKDVLPSTATREFWITVRDEVGRPMFTTSIVFETKSLAHVGQREEPTHRFG